MNEEQAARAALLAHLDRFEVELWRLQHLSPADPQGTLAAWLALALDRDAQLPAVAAEVIAALEPRFLHAAVLIADAQRAHR